MHLKHDANWMKWRVGDRVGIATTSRGESTIHKIASISGKTLQLDSPITESRLGGYKNIEGENI